MVRFIRTWRPTIIISKFEGTPRDGHGHHQASGILTKEAYDAAGDPTRYPEQLDELGLTPWKAKKLYYGSVRTSETASEWTPQAGWTLQIPVGSYDPVLGRSYREIGTEGYSKHRSQGNGAMFSLPAPAYDSYKLLNSTVGSKPKETTFFDSIDTSLSAIAELAGDGKSAVPFLPIYMYAATRIAEQALQAFQATDPGRSAAKVAEGIVLLRDTIRKVEDSELPKTTKNMVLDALREKAEDFENAANAVLGIYLVARADEATPAPGGSLTITATFYNRGSEQVDVKQTRIDLQGARDGTEYPMAGGRLAAGQSTDYKYSTTIDSDAEVTEPYWYRDNPSQDRYKVRHYNAPFAPLGPPFAPFWAPDNPEHTVSVVYRFQNADISISAPVQAQFGDPIRGADFNTYLIVPALSITVTPDIVIAPVSARARGRELQVSILNNDKAGAQGTLKLNAPSGWQVTPAETQFALHNKGETYTGKFSVRIPPGTREGSFPVEAVASMKGREYRRGYRVISHPENWTRNIYSPSRADVEVFDVKVAPGLTVGYVPGAGDDEPTALEQLGVKLQMLGSTDLSAGDLGRYNAIVTGVRAYNVNEALKANNRRLLKYVEDGGTLIVQYNTPLRAGPGRSDGSPFPYGPYPMTNSTTDRITVEESPLKILVPQSPIFNTPNKIIPADFDGWVQERGLYFMNHWDPHYTALLSGHDPGEEPKDGGMLVTRYGKGWYIYTAYSWFRQLPAGVPGAFRIFANMLSLK